MSSLTNVTVRSYNYRLLPKKHQHEALNHILGDQRVLYNAALEERIGACRCTGKVRSYQDQCRAITEWRKEDEIARTTPANLQRWTLKRVDDAFNAFFRRAKAKGEKAGFPRFRSYNRWKTFGFNEFSGIRLIGNRLLFKGLRGGLKIHLHRPLPENPDIRACSFTRDEKGWTVSFQIAIVPVALPKTGKEVGIDLGISTLMALSDGTQIPNMRVGQKAQSELRIAQRSLSRCKKGSRRRKKVKKEVTRLHAKIKNTRSTYLHQVSTRLVKEYDLIAMENLNIKGLASGFLAKQVNDASWGKLQNYIRYKAEGAGKRVVEVSPNYTSQICPGCGVIKPKSLSERVHNCDSCGLVMDRDHASAMVIYDRAVVGPGIGNVVSLGKRRFGNISLEISK